MNRKQNICAAVACAEFIAAAGIIETRPGVALALIAAMTVPMIVGRLDRKRLSSGDIERRCGNAKN